MQYTTTEIANILGSSIPGVTPTPTPGFALALIDDISRGLTAGILAFMDATKGIASLEKIGETVTITYTDGTTQNFTVENGEPGADGIGTGWNFTTSSTSDLSVTLTNGAWYYNDATASSVSIADGLGIGESSVVEFVASTTTYSASSTAYHLGDDCSSGTFTPGTGTYTVTYIKQGAGLTGYVAKRG